MTTETTFTVTISPLTERDCAVLKNAIAGIELLMLDRLSDNNDRACQALMTTLDPLKAIAEGGTSQPMPGPVPHA